MILADGKVPQEHHDHDLILSSSRCFEVGYVSDPRGSSLSLFGCWLLFHVESVGVCDKSGAFGLIAEMTGSQDIAKNMTMMSDDEFVEQVRRP